MKNLTSRLLLVICAWFIVSFRLSGQYVPPVRTMSIPPTVDKIIFDGADNESSYSAPQTLTMFNNTGYNNYPGDFSGFFKVCWDTRFLYFFANITDDREHSFPNAADVYDTWFFDNIEIHIDLDTSGAETYYTDYTTQLRFNRGWNRVMWAGRADAGDFFCNLSNKKDSTGWILETAIPWTCALPSGSLPEDITEYIHKFIGFDVAFNDSDGDNPFLGARDIQSAWDADLPDDTTDRTEDNAWNNRKVFGIVNLLGNPLTAPNDIPPPPPPAPPVIEPTPTPPPIGPFTEYVQPVATMTIPATSDTINFDGVDNELSYGLAQSLTTFNNTGVESDADFSGYFKTSWDKTYLYLFANITDDTDNSDLYGGNNWEYDNIEVFIDLDTSGNYSSYDENTAQLRFSRGWNCVSVTGRATRDNFYYFWTNKDNGWIVETAIPWKCVLPDSSLPEDIMQYLNNNLGFDVMGADSDGNNSIFGIRDGQSSWDMDEPNDAADRTEDNAWNNTKVFGVIKLSGDPIVSPPTPPAAPPAPVPEPLPPNPPAPPATGNNFILPISTMHIPQTYDSMSIDGIANENSYCSAQSLEMFNNTGYDGTIADFDGYFKVCWDFQYLYFFADITDDIDQSVFEDNNAWMYDNIELYLDLAIDSSSQTYDENSVQLRFNRGNDYVMWPGRATQQEFIYNWYNKPGNDGWVVECAIPWKASLPSGKNSEDIIDYIYNNIGFDVIFSDSDGNDPSIGMRDIQMAWDMDDPNDDNDRTEDNAWNNTHVFGIVNLMSDVYLPESKETDNWLSEDKPALLADIRIYPNPATDKFNFENLDKVKLIEILNLMGETICKMPVNDKKLTVNISGLSPEGILLVRFICEDGTSSVRKLILK